MTLTTAELIEGIVDGTPTGNRTITTPTAAEIITALGIQNKVGQCFELTVVNKAASTHKFTLTAGFWCHNCWRTRYNCRYFWNFYF